MRLDHYQRGVADRLRPGAGSPRSGREQVVRDSVLRWAVLQLSGVCPTVSSILARDDRLVHEVALQLACSDRPASLHRWGLQFCERLVADRDAWIVWAAATDALVLQGRSIAMAAPRCPGDMTRSLQLVLSGRDPRVPRPTG